MALLGCRTHQSAASGTQLRPRRLRLGAKHPAERVAPPLELVAPSNGKSHRVSLRELFGVPIIPKILRRRSQRSGSWRTSRRLGGKLTGNSKSCADISKKRSSLPPGARPRQPCAGPPSDWPTLPENSKPASRG